jgi:hypothetical protein
VISEVDMDDSKEVNFMNQLRIDKSQLSASLTLVINTQGQVPGTSTTVPDGAKLVLAAKTPVTAGYGPGCGICRLCEIDIFNFQNSSDALTF